jgi:hypothetical protein
MLLEDGGLWEVEVGDALKLTRVGEVQPGLLTRVGEAQSGLLSRVDDVAVDGAGHMVIVKGDKLHIGGATGWSQLTLAGAKPESRW